MALSHLLQPRSTLQMCRLGFSYARGRCKLAACSNGEIDNPLELKKEAVAEQAIVEPAEPSVKESSKKIPGFFSSFRNELANLGSKKTKALTDLFRGQKDDQTATTAENEEINNEEAISGVVMDFVKNKNAQFEYLSQSSDSVGDHLKESPPHNCKNDLLEYQNARYEGGEMSSPSESIEKGLDLKDCNEKSPDDQQSAREIVRPRSLTLSYQPFEHSNEPHSKNAEDTSLINDLIDFLRPQEDVPSNTTIDHGNTGHIKDNSLNGNSWIKDDETSNLDFSSTVGIELNASVEVSVPQSNEDQKKLKKTCIARKISEENKVIVRFLPRSVTESHIYQTFGSFGEILEVEFPYAEGRGLFKIAYIYFKTREGLEAAIRNSGLTINNRMVSVKSATSMETSVESPITSLIGDPDVPTALVRNPTRTIKIEQLTRDISSHHIEEALAFCDSKVTGYFLGSSRSVAYVEFETEIGKERALAKQSIHVLGSHLVMLRIDSPRTTVVRISNTKSYEAQTRHILPVCRSLGDVKWFAARDRDILDVYFGISEWGNMWKILNRLNGTKFEDRQLQAEPAPVFSPEVLLVLWHHPDGRKHLKATAQNLLGKIMEDTRDDISALASLDVFVDKI